MKTQLMQLLGAMSVLLMSLPVMAHGDHTVMTPDHGLEHAAYYGIGIVAALLVLNQVRKVFLAKKDK